MTRNDGGGCVLWMLHWPSPPLCCLRGHMASPTKTGEESDQFAVTPDVKGKSCALGSAGGRAAHRELSKLNVPLQRRRCYSERL